MLCCLDETSNLFAPLVDRTLKLDDPDVSANSSSSTSSSLSSSSSSSTNQVSVIALALMGEAVSRGCRVLVKTTPEKGMFSCTVACDIHHLLAFHSMSTEGKVVGGGARQLLRSALGITLSSCRQPLPDDVPEPCAPHDEGTCANPSRRARMSCVRFIAQVGLCGSWKMGRLILRQERQLAVQPE